MSFSINYGYRFEVSSFDDLHTKALELKKELEPVLKEEMLEQIKDLQKVEEGTFNQARRNFIFSLYKSYQHLNHCQFSVYFRFYPHDGRFYGFVETTEKGRNVVSRQKWITDYSYFDCREDEIPENISIKEWNERALIWDLVTANFPSAKFGYNLELISFKDLAYELED